MLNGFHNWFYQVIKIKFRSNSDLIVMNTYASNGLNMILSPWHCSFGKWTIKIIKDGYMWNSLMPHKISNDIINGANEVRFKVMSKDDEYNCIQVFKFCLWFNKEEHLNRWLRLMNENINMWTLSSFNEIKILYD